MIDRYGKQITIRQACEGDAKRICEIASESGLISGVDRDFYRTAVGTAAYFFVLECEGKISSYILGCHSHDDVDKRAGMRELNDHLRRMKHPYEASFSLNDESYVLVTQMATAQQFSGRWHARCLYRHLKTLVATAPIYAAIAVSPPNLASIQLHEDSGFIKQFEFNSSDNIRRAYWRCSRIDNLEDPTLLIHQHQLAAELYQHEDSLNWKKLSALYYITGVLIAGVAFLFRALTATPSTQRVVVLNILFALAVFGLFSGLYFVMSIRSGVRFMLQQKRSLMDIDVEVAKLNGVRNFIPITGSPTSTFIRFVPWIVIAFWTIVILAMAALGLSYINDVRIPPITLDAISGSIL